MSKDDSGDGTQPCLDFAWSELSELLRLAQFVGFGLFSDPQQAAYLEQLACLLCNMARGMLAGVHELLTAALEGLPPLLAGRFGLALQPLLAAVTSSAAPALVFARRPGGVGAVSSGQVPHIPLLGESRSNSNRRKPHALAREESMGGGAWRPSADLLADVAVAGNSVSGWAVPGSGPQGLGRVKAVRTALAHTLLQRALRETTRGGSQPQVTLPSPLPPAAAPTAPSATSAISFNSRPQPATIVLADASGAALEEAGPGRDVLLAANLTGVSAVAALLLIAEASGLYGHGMIPGGLGGAFVPGIGSARVRNDSALLPSPSAPLPLLPASTTVAPAAPQPHAVSYVEANGSNAQGMAGGVARVVESFALSLSQQPSPRRTRDGSIGPQVCPRSRIGAPALTAHGGTDGPSLQAAFTSLPGGDVAAGASPRAAANGSSHHHHQVQSFPAAAGSVLPKSPSMNSSLASGPAHASASLTASAPAPFRLALYLVSPESVPAGVLDAVAAEMKVLAPLLFDAFHAALDAGGLAAAEWSSLQGQLMQRCPTTGQLPSHGSIDAAGTTGPGAYGPPHPHSAHPAHVMPSGSSLAPHSPRRGSGSDVASPVPRRGELGGSGSRLRLMSGAENNAATAESGGRRVSRHQTLHGGAPGPGGPGPGPGPSLDPLRNPEQGLLLSESNAGVGGGTRGAAGEGVDEDVLGELLMETQMEDLEGVGRDTVEAYNRAGWSAHPHGRKASRASCLMMSSPLIKLEDVSGPRPLELMVTSARSRLTAVATGGEAGEETRLAVAQDLAAVELLEVVGSGGQGVVFRGSLHGLEAAIKVWEHGARAPLEHDGDGLSGGLDDDDVDAASAASPSGGDRKDAAAAARADEAIQAGSSRDCIRQAKRGAMEVAVTCTLSHPNIVQTYAHFSDVVVVERQTALTAVLGGAPQLRLVAHDDPIFRGGRAGPLNTVLCLEYCDAGTLLSAARRGDFRLPGSGPRDGPVWPDLVPLVTSLLEVALALRYLHARRLVHCDLKPGNVLLKTNSRDPRGWTCKLSDFGCVRLMDDFGTDGSPGFRMAQVFGTVAYMAPECFGRGRLLNAAVDVYAFGILMWELLHCLAPHSKADPKDLPRQVVRHGLRPEFHPLAPPEFSALAARCWAPQPERRPTATQLVAQVQQLLGVARSVASRQRQGGRAHQSAAQTPPLQLQPQPQGVPSPMPQQPPPAKLASPLPSQQRSPPPRQQPSPQPPGPGQAPAAGPGPGQAQGLAPRAQLLMAQPPPHLPVPGTQGQGMAPKDLLRFPSSSLGSRPQLQLQPQPLPHAHSHQPHHHLGGAPRLAERVVVGQAQLAQAAAQQRQAAEAAAAQAGVNGMGAGAGPRAGLGLGLPQSSVGGGVGGGGSWDGQPLPRNAPLGAGGGSRRRPQSVDAPGYAAHLALGALQPAQLLTPQQPEPHLRQQQQQQQPKALSGGQVAAFVNAARAPVIPGPGARAQTLVPNGSGELSLT
ncbi:hypothetical protein HYH03_013907 [Edaphochlamys debaryana]|uniref:Protein kinase domain-containing protein n=1 Tax=Edaphochlamys debaryana TaxID=47281 RepID=A0A835XNV2_9CHLO|nr:hypothetical protein HYH03_013907 [Edaphochlamys debaryana]|eukprot:KAG2487488.1 hypothetical protein HYH03_013907 [Edaphochlamys debaryana]